MRCLAKVPRLDPKGQTHEALHLSSGPAWPLRTQEPISYTGIYLNVCFDLF